ncbi:nuclear transport factor 2 family protein [Microbacterium sp. ASV49]|uniref:Nuclear transport factor 2 family protein n=1 Tax=Microbacterium candidum TaxID=3041922 RepID=A0ABT7N3J8_9MICO|nr:nuclear transport factor 2 family protein [Microbacterium sp. ASV49]MDL9981272.1 nuclear transport factor 2 family protein [Microbacterium sp. ASV49]
MDAFRRAVEARDLDTIRDLLADDVVFRSPVAHKPYPGKAITFAILRHVIEVFQDFTYLRHIGAVDAVDHALVFTARVRDKELTGCDFLHLDEDGRIDDFMVMVRPLSAAVALSEEMAARFDQIQRDAQASGL